MKHTDQSEAALSHLTSLSSGHRIIKPLAELTLEHATYFGIKVQFIL